MLNSFKGTELVYCDIDCLNILQKCVEYKILGEQKSNNAGSDQIISEKSHKI